jgi:hypothetical protein
MTLDKAIEILDRYFVLNHNVPRADVNEAAKLGIEALKKVQRDRELWRVPPLLPGETEESP